MCFKVDEALARRVEYEQGYLGVGLQAGAPAQVLQILTLRGFVSPPDKLVHNLGNKLLLLFHRTYGDKQTVHIRAIVHGKLDLHGRHRLVSDHGLSEDLLFVYQYATEAERGLVYRNVAVDCSPLERILELVQAVDHHV